MEISWNFVSPKKWEPWHCFTRRKASGRKMKRKRAPLTLLFRWSCAFSCPSCVNHWSACGTVAGSAMSVVLCWCVSVNRLVLVCKGFTSIKSTPSLGNNKPRHSALMNKTHLYYLLFVISNIRWHFPYVTGNHRKGSGEKSPNTVNSTSMEFYAVGKILKNFDFQLLCKQSKNRDRWSVSADPRSVVLNDVDQYQRSIDSKMWKKLHLSVLSGDRSVW